MVSDTHPGVASVQNVLGQAKKLASMVGGTWRHVQRRTMLCAEVEDELALVAQHVQSLTVEESPESYTLLLATMVGEKRVAKNLVATALADLIEQLLNKIKAVRTHAQTITDQAAA